MVPLLLDYLAKVLFAFRWQEMRFQMTFLRLLALFFTVPAFAGTVDVFSAGSRPTKAVTVLVHGLNNQPAKMSELKDVLLGEGRTVVLVGLTGHVQDPEAFAHVRFDDWREDVRRAYAKAKGIADSLNVPVELVAYSLGGLVNVNLLLRADLTYDRVVLLAPAISVKSMVKSVKLLEFLDDSFMIPSANHPSYRASSGTTLAAYRALFFGLYDNDMYDDWSRANVPTLVLVDPKDELVSASGLRELMGRYSLDQWRLEQIDASGTELDPSYRHLIITEESVGKPTWRDMIGQIVSHLNGN